jgi:hypothetical protein
VVAGRALRSLRLRRGVRRRLFSRHRADPGAHGIGILFPELADRRAYGEWQESGSSDIRDSAEQRVRDILSAHYPAYIDPKMDEEIRRRFPIVLPREDMQATCGRW